MFDALRFVRHSQLDRRPKSAVSVTPSSMNRRNCPFVTLYRSIVNSQHLDRMFFELVIPAEDGRIASQPQGRIAFRECLRSPVPRATLRHLRRSQPGGPQLLPERQLMKNIGQRLGIHQAMFECHIDLKIIPQRRIRENGQASGGPDPDSRSPPEAAASPRDHPSADCHPLDRCRARRGGETPRVRSLRRPSCSSASSSRMPPGARRREDYPVPLRYRPLIHSFRVDYPEERIRHLSLLHREAVKGASTAFVVTVRVIIEQNVSSYLSPAVCSSHPFFAARMICLTTTRSENRWRRPPQVCVFHIYHFVHLAHCRIRNPARDLTSEPPSAAWISVECAFLANHDGAFVRRETSASHHQAP